MIDEVDYKILEILQEKARIPNVEVARQVGMAPSAVLERIRKLEERGIIDGYEVRLNPQAFSLGLLAFVQVRVQGRLGADLAQQLARVTGVQEVHLIAGDDGYLLRLRVADHAELGQILTSEINALDGVLQTKTSVVLETIKDTEKLDLERF
ncbi:MAG: Lrp/AsnC family transcriptional regulator [Desulfuromonas sp.]|nr:MAG: Lrp/AsnC family transcriptional regulator [Desulfuromonas sp.]